MIGHGRLSAMVAAACMAGSVARPIGEEYEYDDDHTPADDDGRRFVRFKNDPPCMPYRARPELEYFDSGKPLTKRQKRRLRGKQAYRGY